MEEEIEVLDEDFLPVNEPVQQPSPMIEKTDLITIDELFSAPNEEVIDVYEEKLKKEEKRQKKITKIQIGLIVFLIIFATVTYFFGYDIVEPFIKID